MEFFNSAIDILKILVMALGAGLVRQNKTHFALLAHGSAQRLGIFAVPSGLAFFSKRLKVRGVDKAFACLKCMEVQHKTARGVRYFKAFSCQKSCVLLQPRQKGGIVIARLARQARFVQHSAESVQRARQLAPHAHFIKCTQRAHAQKPYEPQQHGHHQHNKAHQFGAHAPAPGRARALCRMLLLRCHTPAFGSNL